MLKTKTPYIAALAAVAVLAAGAASAQTQAEPAKARAEVDRMVELMRKDVRAEKADIVAKTMALDATHAATFWPIYKQYEAERRPSAMSDWPSSRTWPSTSTASTTPRRRRCSSAR